MSFSLDDPPNSRLFVVAGRNTSSDFLRSVFEQYGQVSFVKYLRDKGVAYVKFDRASSAALAIENLHEVTLNDGHGPRLKVMLAESPHARTLPGLHLRRPEDDLPLDPDNTPPRSRLFLVVPKNADGSIIEAEMSRFAGLQYCKTDLISSKGIVFVKYATSSAACMAMETVQMTGMVAGYKVKIMLAEPKTRRMDGGFMQGLPGRGIGLPPGVLPGTFNTAGAGGPFVNSLSPGILGPGGLGLQDFSPLGSLGGNFGPLGPSANLRNPGGLPLEMGGLNSGGALGGGFGSASGGSLAGLGADFGGFGGAGGLGLTSPALTTTGLLGPHHPHSQPMMQQAPPEGIINSRLFIVVHKSATEEALSALFRCYPEMEYLDLKRDRLTGRSKGYAYVNYLSPAAAAAAQVQLNGIEYPPGSGSRLKVLFAEPLNPMSRSRSSDLSGSEGTGAYTGDASGNAASASLLGTPSNDTTGTSFRLPSPSSRESLGGLGQAGLAAAAAQQAQQQLSARTDPSSASHESIISPRSSPLQLNSNHDHMGDLAANLGGLNLGLAPGNGSNVGGFAAAAGGLTHNRFPGSRSSPQTSLSHGSDVSGGSAGDWREPSPDHFSSATTATTSAGVSPAKLTPRVAEMQMPSPDDATVVYSALNRPLPDYALTHIFQQVGAVEFVKVLPDERVAMVKYSSPEAAAAAVGSLNGVEVLGEVLQVRSSPPMPLRAGSAAS